MVQNVINKKFSIHFANLSNYLIKIIHFLDGFRVVRGVTMSQIVSLVRKLNWGHPSIWPGNLISLEF